MSDAIATAPELGPGLTGSPDWPKLVGPLIAARKSMAPLRKAETAEVPTKAGGKYSYHYADLPALLDVALGPLAENGLAVIQAASCTPEYVAVTSVLAHESGPWLANVFRMPVGQQTPQAYGSAETYARRYALLALLALAGEDDDGAAAMPKHEPERRKEPPPARVVKPANEAAEKVKEILREQVRCPREKGEELFDAVTCGKYLPGQLDDPEAAKAILELFEGLAESIPYARWMDEISDLRNAGTEREMDDVFGKAAT